MHLRKSQSSTTQIDLLRGRQPAISDRVQRRRLSQRAMLTDRSEQKQLSALKTLHYEISGRNLGIYHADALPVIPNPISQDDERRLEVSSRLL